MFRTKLFTHTDMDGIGPDIILKTIFGQDQVDTVFCDYNSIDRKLKNFLVSADAHNYDMLYITDLSVNEDVVDLLNSYNIAYCENLIFGTHSDLPLLKIRLFDHHATALWLNAYSWATVSEFDAFGNKTSATELIYNYLLNEYPIYASHVNLEQIVYDINMYDSWRWATDFTEPYLQSKKLNDLFHLLGRHTFSEELRLGKYVDDFSLLLDVERRRIERLLQDKRKTIRYSKLIDTKGFERSFGYVFSESNHSELGNELCKEHPNLDFIAIFNVSKNNVSLRSIRSEDDLHLGLDVASMFNGGGHGPSAGCDLTGVFKDLVLEHLLLGG